jgi:predicted TIM-barrel fold metal-dependent hydrolase
MTTTRALSRREFFKRGAAAVGGAALAGRALSAAAEQPAGGPAGGAIDAHSHIWTPDVKQYPLAKGFDRGDMLPPSFTPQQLLAHARPCGVGRVVLIQMSFYGFDNSFMLDSMRDFPGVFSGVAVVDEDAARLAGTMRDLKKQGVRGFRIHPAQQPVDRWLNGPGMARMWTVGADERLAMCALVNAEALGPLDAMCRKFPRTPLVIDHFARIGVDGTIRDADVDNLCRLARHGETCVKVSAFYALGKKESPYTDLGPMIRRLLGAFGPERLMWATDCPYQVQNGHTYLDSIELVRTRLDFLTEADREWLLGRCAQRVFFS